MPLDTKQSIRLNYLSGFTMLSLLVLAAVFWRERTWFLDVAFQTCLMIKDGTVQVQVYRFGAAIVQVLPLVAIKIGLPLSWVSFLYSISFPLVYLLFWWLIVNVFKQPLMGLALAILYVGMTYDGFYWCTSELQQGLGFLLVVWAMILHHPSLDKAWYWLFLWGAFIALAFYHPLIFIPFFFCWVFFGWENKKLQHFRFILLALLMVFVLVAKGYWFSNWYDTAKMTTFMENVNQHFPNYFTFPAYTKLVKNSILYWWGFPLLGVTMSVYLIYWRKYPLLLFMWLTAVGFIVLNAIGSPDPGYRFYSEVNYYPLILFVAIPFCFLILKNFSSKRWLLLSLVLFLGTRLLLIASHHQPYTDRIDYLSQLIEKSEAKHGEQRYIISQQNIAMDTLVMTWATPFESMLISGSIDPKNVKTLLITPHLEKYTREMRQDSSLFLMEFNNFDIKAFEAKGYFYFKAGHYIECSAI